MGNTPIQLLRKWRRGHYPLLMLVLAALILSGCASTPKDKAATTVPKTLDPELSATVTGSLVWQSLGDTSVSVMAVDGQSRGRSNERSIRAMQVEPGDHVLTVLCVINHFPLGGSAAVDLHANLLAGHQYLLKCNSKGRDATVWLEDKATGQTIGDVQEMRAETTMVPDIGVLFMVLLR